MFMLVTNRGPEPVDVSDGQHVAVGQSAIVEEGVTFRTERGSSDLQWVDVPDWEVPRLRAELHDATRSSPRAAP